MPGKPCDHLHESRCPCDYPAKVTYRISSGGIDPAEYFENWSAAVKDKVIAFSKPTTFDRGLWTLWEKGAWPGRMPFELVT